CATVSTNRYKTMTPPITQIIRMARLVSQGVSHDASSRSSPAAAYPLSLHDALPISPAGTWTQGYRTTAYVGHSLNRTPGISSSRSEEHTSELQSPYELVCRLLLAKQTTSRPWPTGRLIRGSDS